jgi:integrase
MKVNDAYDEWSIWLDVDKSPRTAEEYKKVVKHYLKDAKVKNLDKVTPIELSNWINKKGKAGLGRRKLVLSVIKSFYRYAHATGITKVNPAEIVKVKTDNLTHKQKESKRVDAMTEMEVSICVSHLDKLLREHETSWKNDMGIGSQYRGERKYTRQKKLKRKISECRFFKAAILLSYETGLRLSDICQLEWDCIEGNQLVVHTDKRDKRVAIPMWAEVKMAINCIPERDDDEELYCFPDYNEKYNNPKTTATISNAFKRILRNAGVSRNGLSFHSLRHACLTKWESGGLDLEHIQKLAGHSSSETTKGYIHK